METELGIEHDGLDPDVLDPDGPDDDGDDEDYGMVTAAVMMPGGMRYSGTVFLEPSEGPATPEVVAEALVRATFGAAMTHSPAAVAALARWARHPQENP